MNETLAKIYQAILVEFEKDDRVLAAWEFGSIGKGTSDELSDVDPAFLIRDEGFDDFDRALPQVFARLGCEIVLWWPEGFNDADIKNYAILIKADELIQYDMTIIRESSLLVGRGKRMLTESGGIQVLFDKAAIIARALASIGSPRYSADHLVWEIQRYWVYVYILVKYLRRGDVYKILYAQQTLAQNHLRVLQAVYPPEVYWGWWPWTAKHVLSEKHQTSFRLYFDGHDVKRVRVLVSQEIDRFSEDAREACRKQNKTYPQGLEEQVRAHLEKHVLSA